MEAIVAFLTARYDEEELMALAAIDDDSGQDGGFEDAYEDLIRPPSGVGTAQGGFGQAVARMIAWNTPRRVLADVAAKRAIVAMHRPVDYTAIGMDSPNACVICGADLGMGEWEWVKDSYPCQTLQLLASLYESHKDYDPSWRVG